MIKFESVIKNINDSLDTNGIFFVLDKNKINYVYSNNQKQLIDVFNIITGFYKPNIGGLIYDDYDLNQFGLNDKAFFIRNNVSIIIPINTFDRNITVYDFLNLHSICVYKKKQDRVSIINQIIKEFELEYFKYTKIDMLSNNLILKLLIANAKLSNPKYLFFYGIEQYISTNESYLFFLKLILDNFDLNNIVLTIFTNQKPNNDKNKQIKYKLINLDDLDQINKELLIRDKKLSPHKNFSGNFFKLFLSIFSQKWISNLTNVFLFILLGITFSFSLISIFTYSENSSFNKVIVIFLGIINFLFSFYFSINIYNNIKNRLFLITRWGLSLIECFTILILFILTIFFLYSLSFIIPIICFYFVKSINVDWILSLILLFLIGITSFLTFLLIFIFKNRRMIIKYEDIW